MKKLYKTIILGIFLKAFAKELDANEEPIVSIFFADLLSPYV